MTVNKMIMLLVALIAVISSFINAENVASTSTCVCTTVPCPVAGYNYLTDGKRNSHIIFFRNDS